MSGSVWVKVHPDYAGGSGTLDPAQLLSDPVAVTSANPVQSHTVKLTDGTSKKIWFLPGRPEAPSNQNAYDHNIFEVELSPGVLQGILVAAGGQAGAASAGIPGGAGGAGGVIGSVCHQKVILPSSENETYTIAVPPMGVGGDGQPAHSGNGKPCTIAIKGQTPFAAAVGGGKGTGGNTNYADQASQGGSGGGSGGWGSGAVDPNVDPQEPAFANGALGIPGQGHAGGPAAASNGGGGGGYGGRPSSPSHGGAGFDLVAALSLDTNDGPTATFVALVTVDGKIAGGGAAGGYPAEGGGGTNGGHGADYTGGGGGSTGATKGAGGCGMVLLVTEV